MKVLLAGGGNTLYFLSKRFTSKGYEVTVINRDREECVRLARQLKAAVVYGDGSDPQVLKEAGAMGADAVIAITPDDQDNLVICQLASHQFGVPKALALANDPDNAEIFQELGVSAFSYTPIIANLIEQRASLEEIINLLPVAQGQVNVTEIVLNQDCPVSGKLLKEIVLPENALVAVLIREARTIVPRGGTRLMPADRLILITLPENHGPVLKLFTGEGR